jgi:carbon monoxide dehydrogenase subunit G
MRVEREFDAPVDQVWDVSTDVERCADFISSVTKVAVLSDDTEFKGGFKWKETRVMFGSESSEEMWIKDLVKNEHYTVGAQSCGTAYRTVFSFEPLAANRSKVTVTFEGTPLTWLAYFMTPLVWLLSSTLKAALSKDLEDIDAEVQKRQKDATKK